MPLGGIYGSSLIRPDSSFECRDFFCEKGLHLIPNLQRQMENCYGGEREAKDRFPMGKRGRGKGFKSSLSVLSEGSTNM